MKKLLTIVLVMFAASAMANITYNCDFENGELPIGYYGTGEPPIIATSATDPDPVYFGLWSLRLEDNSPTGTPQAFLAWVKGLQAGGYVEAGFYRYDDTPGTSPSVRIWGHWNDDPVDVNGYHGSAGGNDDYGEGLGWDLHSWNWTADGTHTGLIIEARTYSNPGDTCWIDDFYVSAPSYCEVVVMEGGTATMEGSWSDIKALY